MAGKTEEGEQFWQEYCAKHGRDPESREQIGATEFVRCAGNKYSPLVLLQFCEPPKDALTIASLAALMAAHRVVRFAGDDYREVCYDALQACSKYLRGHLSQDDAHNCAAKAIMWRLSYSRWEDRAIQCIVREACRAATNRAAWAAAEAGNTAGCFDTYKTKLPGEEYQRQLQDVLELINEYNTKS